MGLWFLDGGGGWRYVIPYIKKGDTVVGTNNSINRFFEEFTEANVVRLRARPSLWDGSVRSVFRNILISRKEYKEYFRGITGQRIYLFGGLTAITFFSIVKKLRKNNTIVYVAKRRETIYHRTYRKTPYWIPMKIIGFIMGIDVGVTKLLGKPLWFIKEKTLGNYEYLKYELKEPKIEIPKKYRKLLKRKDTLLLLNDLETLHKFPETISDNVACLLDKERTIIKNHTREPKIFGELSEFDKFPSFIPSETLINSYNWKYVISIYASKSMIYKTDSCMISMYNMFDGWINKVNEGWFKLYFGHGVLMPKNEKEFKEIVK